MDILGLTKAQLQDALQIASLEFNGNLDFQDLSSSLNQRGDRFRLRLRVKNTRRPGTQFSAPSLFINHYGRRTIQACWHAHRDFFYAVYDINPEARIRTALTTYRSLEDFEDTFRDTKHSTRGSSRISPTDFGDRCECDGPT